jgi:sulfate-transporting ATPase
VGAQQPQGAPGQEQGATEALRGTVEHEYQKRNETQEIFIPPGERLGELVIELQGLARPSATSC